LEINKVKIKVVKWKNNSKFDFLGFTFHYLSRPRLSKITMQSTARSGLYIYPSSGSVKIFKAKIKKLIRLNTNASPYKLIHLLNPVIGGWGSYFDVGSYKIFSKLDHFIRFRLMRYLKRKFPNVPKSILVQRFFTGVSGPGNKVWRFHDTLQNLYTKDLKRKGKVVWLLVLCQLNSPTSYINIRPNKKLLESSFYINPEESIKYDTKVIALRTKENTSSNKWSQLYNLQKGFCPLCNQGLGYLLKNELEICHKIKAHKLPPDHPLLKGIDNLQLVHKTCHKSNLKKK
jgi:RNA-directed DNA polymerase